MANTFKNKITTNIGTTSTTVYTAGAGVVGTIIGLTIANTTNGSINASLTLTDSSTSVTGFLIKDVVIGAGVSLVPIGGEQKIVVEENDYLQITSNTNSSVDVIVSVLEIS